MLNTRTHSAWLTALIIVGTLTSCAKKATPTTPTSPYTITVNQGELEWVRSVSYSADDSGTHLSLDGVLFELRDTAAYDLNWDALGVSSITSTPSHSNESNSSYTYETNKRIEGVFLIVQGKAVEIHEGVLTWGEDVIGPVSAGDRFVVDQDGLH